MPQFEYKARERDGTISTGTIDTVDRRQASQRLKEQQLTPITLKQTVVKSRSKSFSHLFNKTPKRKSTPVAADGSESAAPKTSGRGPTREKIGLEFLKRLIELHGSGLPIGDSIRILSQRLSDPEQKELASSIWRDLSEGSTLANALSRQSKYYAASVTYVIEAGEATGSLSPVLRKVINYLEEKQAIRKKMLSSMAYPGFVCTVAFGVVIVFLVVLLPQIQSMLDKLGGEMTFSAKLLISGSDFLVKFGPFGLIGIMIGIILLNQWRKTSKGLKTSDQWSLKIPLIGKIFYYSDLFQSGNLISTLLESGINTTETLRLTERTIKNTALRESFHTARGQVNEGLSLAQALKRNDFMPNLALDILTVGENTGNLSHSMNEVTKGFRDELTRRLTQLTNIVSSGALVFAFLLVALIAIGIVTSVFAVSDSLST